MPLDTSIPLQVQIPQFAEPIDPATRQYNALRQQALQQEMMRNQLIMQNTMEDRRLAAAQRAQAAAQAAAERRRQEEMAQVLRSGYRPAREAVMGPGTIQGSTPASYDFSGVTNAMLQRGNIGAVESLSKLQQQIAGQQKAEAEVPGIQAESRKKGVEADKAEFANAFDQMSVLAPYVANGAIPARVAADALLRHPVAGKLLSSTMTREEIYDFADKNPQAVAQILATPPDKIYESLAAPKQNKAMVLPPGSILVDPTSGQPIARGEPVSAKGQLTEAQKARLKSETAQDYNAASTALRDAQDLLGSVDKLSKADLSGVTGYQSILPSFQEESLKAESQIKSLEGRMTALGKSLSAATGKLGNLAVQEYELLRNQIANFDPYKGEAATRQQLADIDATVKRIQYQVRDVYSRTYGDEDNPFPQFRELPEVVGEAPPKTPPNPIFDAADAVLRGR